MEVYTKKVITLDGYDREKMRDTVRLLEDLLDELGKDDYGIESALDVLDTLISNYEYVVEQND